MSEPGTEAPASAEEGTIGLRHKHGHEVVTTIGELRHAHRFLHWDTSISRILSVEVCHVCGEHDRQSVQECAKPDCQEHRICEVRFR